MANESSAVLEYGVPELSETASLMADKLRFHTDSWDLSVDLKSGHLEIVVIDARSREAYAEGHIPSAVSFPHREMTIESTERLDRRKVYVIYCDGIRCNASTKGVYKLSCGVMRDGSLSSVAAERWPSCSGSAGARRKPRREPLIHPANRLAAADKIACVGRHNKCPIERGHAHARVFEVQR